MKLDLDQKSVEDLKQLLKQHQKNQSPKGQKRAKSKRTLPNVFTIDQVIKLFDYVDNASLGVMIMLAFTSGLRRKEICTIAKRNIKWEDGTIKVYGKTGEDYVPIRPFMLPILRKWERLTGDSPWLFPSHKDPTQCVSQGFYNYYRRCLQRAGLYDKDFVTAKGHTKHSYNFHTLRHSFCTYLLDRNMNNETVRLAMRHSKIQTTQIYSHISPIRTKDSVDQLFSVKTKREPTTREQPAQMTTEAPQDPINILALRLAKGEITLDQFNQIKLVLETKNLQTEEKPTYWG